MSCGTGCTDCPTCRGEVRPDTSAMENPGLATPGQTSSIDQRWEAFDALAHVMPTGTPANIPSKTLLRFGDDGAEQIWEEEGIQDAGLDIAIGMTLPWASPIGWGRWQEDTSYPLPPEIVPEEPPGSKLSEHLLTWADNLKRVHAAIAQKSAEDRARALRKWMREKVQITALYIDVLRERGSLSGEKRYITILKHEWGASPAGETFAEKCATAVARAATHDLEMGGHGAIVMATQIMWMLNNFCRCFVDFQQMRDFADGLVEMGYPK